MVTFAVASLLRGATALGDFRTTDERTWLVLSATFDEAVEQGRPADTTVGGPDLATMPGVTTMMIGTAAIRTWNLGAALGVVPHSTEAALVGSLTVLDLAQIFMGFATAALVALLAFLVARWSTPVAGAVVGLLLATEPFLVAHGAVLHTDELVALFGMAAALSLALALGVPTSTSLAGRRRAGVGAGALFAGALLTKVTALVFLPGMVLVVLVALWRGRRPAAGDRVPATIPHPSRRMVARLVVAFAVTAVVVTFVADPALWVAPVREARFVAESAEMGSAGHQQFYRGEITATPGPTFYPVSLALRTTPWFLLAAVVAGVAVWVRPATRSRAAVLACIGIPILVLLGLAAKQFDRYGIALLVVAAVVVGVAAGDLAGALRRRGLPMARLGAVAACGAALVVAWSADVAPWGLAHYNPLLGGADRAERTVLVGWGEGIEQASGFVARRDWQHCHDVTVWGPIQADQLECGTLVAPDDDPDYVAALRQPSAAPDRPTAGEAHRGPRADRPDHRARGRLRRHLRSAARRPLRPPGQPEGPISAVVAASRSSSRSSR